MKIRYDGLDKAGHSKGYLELKNCGEFELMDCIANCRILKPLSCSMTAKTLKSYFGQAEL